MQYLVYLNFNKLKHIYIYLVWNNKDSTIQSLICLKTRSKIQNHTNIVLKQASYQILWLDNTVAWKIKNKGIINNNMKTKISHYMGELDEYHCKLINNVSFKINC